MSNDIELLYVSRSVVLRLASIIVLVVSLQTKISECRSDDEEEEQKNKMCHNCQETQVRQRFSKIVLLLVMAFEAKVYFSG